MKIKLLTTSWQRSWGATLSNGLRDTVLVFVYPYACAHLFQTYLCPPLRILAINEQGSVSYDQVVSASRFVRLPASRIVLECDPAIPLPSAEYFIHLALEQPADMAAWNENVSLDRLLLALLAHAVADMRRVNEANRRSGNVNPHILREKFSPSERGQILNSAGFIQDFMEMHSLPLAVIRLARQVMQIEQPYLDELLAASLAGAPWKHGFPHECLRCHKPASWRTVIFPPSDLPIEFAWRYQRPENAVPLCRKCIITLDWRQEETQRLNLAWGLWGPRFEAFQAWHCARRDNHLPLDWCRQAYPLWPRQFGGEGWESGSGALEHVDPRPPRDLPHSEAQLEALRHGLRAWGRLRHTPGLQSDKVIASLEIKQERLG